MFSCPPAIIKSASLLAIALAAIDTAFNPEPQTLLIVTAGTDVSIPALIAVCRAGFCPDPPVITCPNITSLINLLSTLLSSKIALITLAPSAGAGICDKLPRNEPTAVLLACVINTSLIFLYLS